MLSKKEYIPLGAFITEYSEKNINNKYRPVAVGRYGIRKRESIYSKELAKDYAKNKLIFKDTLTVGMGSTQIDIGILTEDEIYSVSPAYHTYKINNIDSAYLRYCLFCRNKDMFNRYVKRGSRQGKTIDFQRWLEYKIPIYDKVSQDTIVKTLGIVENILNNQNQQLKYLDFLIKARFVEMFGDPKINPHGFEKRRLGDTCKVITGNTPSRAVDDYYGDFIEWIKTDNIVSGLLNPTKAVEALSEKGMKVGRTVDSGAILMACIAGSVASIGKVCITDRKVAFNQQINAIVPQKYDVNFLYVLLQLSKDYLVEEINIALKGLLSKTKLEDKVFILPPIEMQKEFTEFIKYIDNLKINIQKSLDETQKLFDSLMQQYFD